VPRIQNINPSLKEVYVTVVHYYQDTWNTQSHDEHSGTIYVLACSTPHRHGTCHSDPWLLLDVLSASLQMKAPYSHPSVRLIETGPSDNALW